MRAFCSLQTQLRSLRFKVKVGLKELVPLIYLFSVTIPYNFESRTLQLLTERLHFKRKRFPLIACIVVT